MEVSSNMMDFFASTMRALCNRTLFISISGHLGLVLEPTASGDTICVLFRRAVLFVLRKHGDNYLLTGECYCHGIMDGEAMRGLEIAKLKAQDFALVLYRKLSFDIWILTSLQA